MYRNCIRQFQSKHFFDTNVKSVQKVAHTPSILLNLYRLKSSDVNKNNERRKSDNQTWLKSFKSINNTNATNVINHLVKTGQFTRAILLYDFHRQNSKHASEFRLSDAVVLSIVNKMVNNGEYEKARTFFSEHGWNNANSTILSKEERMLLENILNKLGSAADLDEFERFANEILFRRKYLDRKLLDQLMRVPLEHDNIDLAVRLFHRIATEYNTAPNLHLLTCKLIEREEVESLQNVLEIATTLFGERNSFIGMAFAFAECNRIDQANKIFASLKIDGQEPRLDSTIQHIRLLQKPNNLLNLLKATKGCVPAMYRAKMYETLIELLANKDAVDELKELLLTMEAEQVMPSKENVAKCIASLKKKKIEVPSAWIAANEKGADDDDVKLESYLKENRLSEANVLLTNMLEQGKPLTRSILRYSLASNKQSGNIEFFNSFRSKFDVETKELLLFSDFECQAYINAGKYSEYIRLLRSDMQQSNANLKWIVKSFSYGLIDLLDRSPESYDEFKTMCAEVASKGFIKPSIILWTHNFLSDKNSDDNAYLWHEYLQYQQTILCKHVTHILYKRKRINKLQEFLNLELLDKHRIDKSVLGKSYSNLLDGLLFENKYDVIFDELKKAVKLMSVNNLKSNTLNRLKFGPNDIGKRFWQVINEAKIKS